MIHDEQSKSAEGLVLSPKMSFIMGLVGGVLLLCTIGFFILLGLTLKGSKVSPIVDSTANGPTKPAAEAPAAAPTAEAPAAVGEVKAVTSADHIRGDVNAKITLVEYSDIQCPYCSRFHTTMQQVMTEYKGKVRWVFRHFPLSFHPNATPAANAAECAGEQGKFWEFTDKMYEQQDSLGEALYTKTATELKLNMTKFNACYKDKKYQSVIDADRASGSAAGVNGTPGTIIIAADGSKQMIPGALPFEQVKPMIDSVLQ